MYRMQLLKRLPFNHGASDSCGLIGTIMYSIPQAEGRSSDTVPLFTSDPLSVELEIYPGAGHLHLTEDGTLYFTLVTTLVQQQGGKELQRYMHIEPLPDLIFEREVPLFGGSGYASHGLIVTPQFVAVEVAGPGGNGAPRGRFVQLYRPDGLQPFGPYIEHTRGMGLLSSGSIVLGGQCITIVEPSGQIARLEVVEHRESCGTFTVLASYGDQILVDVAPIFSGQCDLRVYTATGKLVERYQFPSQDYGFSAVMNDRYIVLGGYRGEFHFIPRGMPTDAQHHLQLGQCRISSKMPGAPGRPDVITPGPNSVQIRDVAFDEHGNVLLATVRTEELDAISPSYQHAELLRWTVYAEA